MREGHDWLSPSQAHLRPKVMIINRMAGSGGDALPGDFRKGGQWTGTGTRGGLAGIGYPELLDGGAVMAPRGAIDGLTGEWGGGALKALRADIEVDLSIRRVPARTRPARTVDRCRTAVDEGQQHARPLLIGAARALALQLRMRRGTARLRCAMGVAIPRAPQ